jgi:xylulokinase
MDRLAGEVPPGSDGLIFHPYLQGERGPHWDPFLKASFIGLTMQHRRAHFARALYEGIAFSVRDLLEAAKREGLRFGSFRLIGGGARSALWRQIIADVTGKGIRRCGTPEASALGAAMLGAAGVGIHPGVREAAETMTRLDAAPTLPDSERREAYSRLYEEVYRLLFPTLRMSMRRLGALT